eukprot:2725057-Rhodomonas_salina.1
MQENNQALYEKEKPKKKKKKKNLGKERGFRLFEVEACDRALAPYATSVPDIAYQARRLVAVV